MRRNRPGADSRQSPTFAPYFDMDLRVYVCTVCPRSMYISSGPRHRIARARDIRRRAPGVRAREW